MTNSSNTSSVALKEAIIGYQLKKDGIYLDCTFGRGGHSREILKNLGAKVINTFDRRPGCNRISKEIMIKDLKL